MVAQPQNQAAATREQVEQALRDSHMDDDTKLALGLQWLTAARVGDILKAKARCFHLQGPNLTVTFDAGKGVEARGPYSVHTAVTEPVLGLLRRRLAACQPETLVIPPLARHFERESLVIDALRSVDGKLSTRALRRGALQAMAMQGTDMQTLMQFSGHKNEETLKRYLNWGRMYGAGQVAGRQAATRALGLRA